MRRKDRCLSQEESIEILNKGEYGILSTSLNGVPYGVPVNYVTLNECIYIHGTSEGGHKFTNIEENPNVCFTVVGQTELQPDQFSTRYESIVATGTAAIINGEEKIKALEEFIKKYSPNFMESGMKYIKGSSEETSIIKIEVTKLSGKGKK